MFVRRADGTPERRVLRVVPGELGTYRGSITLDRPASVSVLVFENEAWLPMYAQFDQPSLVRIVDDPAELVVTDLTAGIPVLSDRRSSTDHRGQVGEGPVVVAESFDDDLSGEMRRPFLPCTCSSVTRLGVSPFTSHTRW